MPDNPYAPPLSTPALQPARAGSYYVVGTTKFVVMSVLLGGLYWTYWYYRQWKAWRQLSGEPVIAWLRGLFSIFFVYSLFMNIDKSRQQSGAAPTWGPGGLALWLVVVGILTWAAPFFMPPGIILMLTSNVLITVTTILLMLRAQRVINVVSGDPQGLGNRRVTWINALWIVGMMILVGFIGFAVGLLAQRASVYDL